MSQQKKEASISEYNGIEFRGKAPNLKKEDVPPVLDHDVHIDVLDLTKSEDIKKYEEVCQKFVSGKVKIFAEDRKWCEQTGSFKVFLKWAEIFYRMPTVSEIKSAREQMMGMLQHG